MELVVDELTAGYKNGPWTYLVTIEGHPRTDSDSGPKVSVGTNGEYWDALLTPDEAISLFEEGLRIARKLKEGE